MRSFRMRSCKAQIQITSQAEEQHQVERRRPTWLRTRQKVIISLIVVMVLIHPTLTRRSVQLITCDRLSPGDAKTFLRSDYGVECWIHSHWVWGVFIGIPFLILCKWTHGDLSLSLSLVRPRYITHCSIFNLLTLAFFLFLCRRPRDSGNLTLCHL